MATYTAAYGCRANVFSEVIRSDMQELSQSLHSLSPLRRADRLDLHQNVSRGSAEQSPGHGCEGKPTHVSGFPSEGLMETHPSTQC